MIDPTTRADQWLYTTLKNDATLTAMLGGSTNPRIYADLEPQGNTVYPVCVWQMQAAAPDVRPNGLGFVYSPLLYLVKAIDKSNNYPQAVVDRIGTLLDNKSGSATGGTVIFCQREMPWRMTEVDAGITYKHVGATWRLWVTGS